MTGDPHAHPRPCPADLRAAIAVTRVVLQEGGSGHAEAHAAATGHGICPACTAVAAASLGITLASVMAGDKAFTSEPVRLRLLAAVDAAEQELGAAPN
jgi:hypothetical protein